MTFLLLLFTVCSIQQVPQIINDLSNVRNGLMNCFSLYIALLACKGICKLPLVHTPNILIR